MSLLRLALSNVLALRRRLYGLITLVTVAAAVCLASLGIADRAQGAADNGVRESYANRSIKIDRSDGDRPDAKPLTDRAERRLRALPGVQSVQHRAQASFGLKDDRVDGVLLYATTHRASLAPPVLDSVRSHLFPLRPGEVVLPATAQGENLAPELGRKITVETTRYIAQGQGTGASDTVRVVGLYDPAWQLDGPDVAYADDATVVRWAAAKAGMAAESYPSTVGYDQLTVVAESSGKVADVQHRIQRLGYPATTLRQELSALPGVLELIRTVGRVLVVVLGLLSFAGAATVTGALARQRSREIGILKAVGFRTRSVLTLLVLETALAGAVAAVLGTVLGAALSGAGAAALRSRTDTAAYVEGAVLLPGPGMSLLLLGALVVVVVAGALLPARRAAALPPTDAMKDW
ncbi:ABC transporter permease [Streptomyces sp. Ru73]|uniref:FtsX-like permease family protein n=1 Tax=Streptomyces sp. Ru73 TaxID=2080748 RepID=UPI000CDE1E1A|nr:ABC transporter permease [Streptomyces sp. Ru73]POX39033.1 ABC transporter permease [Streptomyces sp. Ru73]